MNTNHINKANSLLSLSKLLSLAVIVFSIGFSSCVSKKKMVYLQSQDQEQQDTVFKYDRPDYKLQANDILAINIVSLEEKANEIFNAASKASASGSANVGLQNGGDIYYMTGYTIDDSGFVELPIVGEVYVKGKTLEEAKAAIDAKVKKYFSLYYLNVKLGGLRYTALGEFNAPGKYTIMQNQATILDAIANAGDLNMVASRKDVKIIRQYPDGTRIHTVNLLDRNLINTPYYFIQPNDVIYVEPLKAKSWGVGVTGAQSLTLTLSIVSTTLILITTILALTR